MGEDEIKVISITNAEWEEDKQVVAHVQGALAIHPLDADNEEGQWVVTHVPTGCHIGIYLRRTQAEMLRSLVADLLDWDKVEYIDSHSVGVPTKIKDHILKLQVMCRKSELVG